MNSSFLSINTFIRYLSSALMILYAVCKLLLRGFFRLHFFLATSSQTTNAVLMNCSVDFRSRRSQQVIYQKSFFQNLDITLGSLSTLGAKVTSKCDIPMDQKIDGQTFFVDFSYCEIRSKNRSKTEEKDQGCSLFVKENRRRKT